MSVETEWIISYLNAFSMLLVTVLIHWYMFHNDRFIDLQVRYFSDIFLFVEMNAFFFSEIESFLARLCVVNWNCIQLCRGSLFVWGLWIYIFDKLHFHWVLLYFRRIPIHGLYFYYQFLAVCGLIPISRLYLYRHSVTNCELTDCVVIGFTVFLWSVHQGAGIWSF